ncbi:hypothetical protein IR151_11145 [Clostridioides sp. ES-S-0006-03]|uniref:S8 family serine peptidase n=1 Tax=Clostridioides sp. ES-S-0006-03 TaxID=2770775 RepID=UPI001D0C0413|nr:hypothetical protein [Clostridioides sp. ES-S-0006-03]
MSRVKVAILDTGIDIKHDYLKENIIGEMSFILKDSFWYNKDYDIQCVIDNNSYLSCSLNNSYQLFGKSNSQATARLTGKTAKVM